MSSRTHDWKTLPRQAVVYSGVVITVGTAILVYAAIHPFSRDSAQFFCYLLIAVLASRLKTSLPEATGTVPAEFLFILLGVLELSFAETLALGCFTVLLHLPKRSRRRALQITFRVCLNAIAVTVTYAAFYFTQTRWQLDNATLPLLVAALTYFIVHTAASAAGTALRLWKPFREVWRGYFWSLPYHLVGAAIALGIRWCNRLYHWQSSLLLLPAMYVLYWSPADEMAMARGWLDHLRESALFKLQDLDDAQLRYRPAPVANSLGIIVVHLGYAERLWFREIFVGEVMDTAWRSAMFDLPDTWSVADVVAFYRAEIAAAGTSCSTVPAPSTCRRRPTSARPRCDGSCST